MLRVDRPITKISQEALGYLTFARALARAIFVQPIKEGLVIAINGPWGSGKTSVVHLAIEELKILEASLAKAEKTVVVEFQPWLFTGQHNLVSEFFSTLAPHLKKHVGTAAADAAVGMRNAVIRNSEAILSSAGVVAAMLGEPVTSALAKSGSKVLKARKESEVEGLARHRERLRRLLQREKRRILVVIDDIDRLEPDEMQLMLGMLKSVADLPGVTYLLPIDMEVVRRATRLDSHSDDASYVEKIVQVNLDLPNPSKNGLDELFSAAIKELSREAAFDESDLQTAGYYIFNGYIRTPRNINQLANALSISWPALREEVYFPDLMCVEALRIFEPAVYKFVRGKRSEILLSSSDRDAALELRATIVGLLRDSTNENAKSLLRHMFPVFGFNQVQPSILNGRRLQNEEGYDQYFRWSSDPNVITVPEIHTFQMLLRENGDASDFVKVLAARKTAGGISASNSLLDALSEGTIVPADVRGAVVSLLSNYAAITDARNNTDFLFTSHRRLNDALSKLLELIPVADRYNLATWLLMDRRVGLDAGAALLNTFIYEKDNPWLDEAMTIDLVRRWKETKVTATALKNSRKPAAIIFKISHALGAQQAKALVAPLLQDRPFDVKLALDLMSRVNSSSKPKPYRELTRLPDPEIFDLPLMAARLADSGSPELPKSDEEDLERFVSALRKYLDKGERPSF